MSLASARKHWRFLATVLLIFVVLAMAGPLLFFGLGSLLGKILERFGSDSIIVLGLGFGLVTLAWLFFVIWAGDKADHLTLDNVSNDARDHEDG